MDLVVRRPDRAWRDGDGSQWSPARGPLHGPRPQEADTKLLGLPVAPAHPPGGATSPSSPRALSRVGRCLAGDPEQP